MSLKVKGTLSCDSCGLETEIDVLLLYPAMPIQEGYTLPDDWTDEKYWEAEEQKRINEEKRREAELHLKQTGEQLITIASPPYNQGITGGWTERVKNSFPAEKTLLCGECSRKKMNEMNTEEIISA